MRAAINALQRELRVLERLQDSAIVEIGLSTSTEWVAELSENITAISREDEEIRTALTILLRAQAAQKRPRREDEA